MEQHGQLNWATAEGGPTRQKIYLTIYSGLFPSTNDTPLALRYFHYPLVCVQQLQW